VHRLAQLAQPRRHRNLAARAIAIRVDVRDQRDALGGQHGIEQPLQRLDAVGGYLRWIHYSCSPRLKTSLCIFAYVEAR
jgi:hypothetical protein